MAGGVITTGSIPRLLQDGVRTVFDNQLDKHESKYDKIFRVLDSSKAFELDVQMEGFGLPSEKDEGDDITFDTRMQGFTPKYVHIELAKGYIVTQVALEDEQYGQLNDGAQALADSMNIGREVFAHSVLNNGFDSNYTMTDGDGSALFSTSHTAGPSGTTYSNKLSVDADLSEASLEDLLAQLMTFEDERGLRRALMADRLIVAAGTNVFNAQRIMGSVLQNDTANNATNAVRDLGLLKNGWMSSPYLTDADAWFLTTNHPNGLKFYQRVDIQFGQDNAFTSGNARFKARQRISYGWTSAAGVYGSQGA